jgi:hypothetical protein
MGPILMVLFLIEGDKRLKTRANATGLVPRHAYGSQNSQFNLPANNRLSADFLKQIAQAIPYPRDELPSAPPTPTLVAFDRFANFPVALRSKASHFSSSPLEGANHEVAS